MGNKWQKKPFEKVFTVVTPPAKIKASEVLPEGVFPVVSQESNFIDGYWNQDSDVIKVDSPLVIFGDHTRITKYVDFDFVQGADGIKILRASNEVVPRYLFYAIQNCNFKSLGYARHFKILKKEEIVFPQSLEEQKRIVRIIDKAFEKIDAIRRNAEESLQEAYELYQEGLRNAMLPQKSWITVFLPDISENLDSWRVPITKSKRTPGKIPYYGASGIVDYVKDYIFDEPLLLISEDGANLLSRTTPIAFSISGKTWVNNHAHILRFKNSVTQQFIEFLIASTNIEKFVTGTAQPKLNQQKMNSIPLVIPADLEEQKKIVQYLITLSNLCTQLEQNCQQITVYCEEMKKAILAKAFRGEL
ncbi:MAG: restriction endonuclease subunit S [Thermoguttaceae bacterium]|nr:restriction endonuclease subunit S [Thermoguttaceae bacterium]